MARAVQRPFLPGFIAPAFAASAVGTPLVLFLPEYYTSGLGFDLVIVGQALLAVRLLDIAIKPALGWTMDRMHARGVGFRPWMLAGTPLLTAAMAALFLAPEGVGPAWLTIWLVAAFIAHSIYALAHLSWATSLASDDKARSRILSWYQAAATLGQLAILAVPTVAAHLSGGDHIASMRALGWLMVCALPVATLVAFLSAAEPAKRTLTGSDAPRGLIGLLTQRPVLTLFLIALLMGCAVGINASTALFYLIGQIGLTRAEAGLLSVLSLGAALAGVPILYRLAQRHGKSKVLALGAGFYAAGQILLMLAPPGNLAWAILTSLIVGLAAPTAMLLPRLIVAEIAQAETSRSGADHVSFLLATLSSTEKLGIAIAVGLIFIGLGWADFDPQRASAAEFELLLRVASAGLPALLFLAAAALAWRFPPTPAPPAGIRSGSSR